MGGERKERKLNTRLHGDYVIDSNLELGLHKVKNRLSNLKL